jgi:hypothetical protein
MDDFMMIGYGGRIAVIAYVLWMCGMELSGMGRSSSASFHDAARFP